MSEPTAGERQAAMDEAHRQMLGWGEGPETIRCAEAFGLCYYAFLSGMRWAREICPHGMVLADNVCGPCSEGRPNRITDGGVMPTAPLPIMTTEDVLRIFKPLPPDEATALREYGVDDSSNDGDGKHD
jgi:hypothetical protein